MKIAVIGAGIFGSTIAIKLAHAGYKVDLYEKNSDVLMAASGINQYRLHRGYHYPRSVSTATSSNLAEPSFRKEYKEAVIDTKSSYYVIAKKGSKVSAKEFKDFCDKCRLGYKEVKLEVMNPLSLQEVFQVRESIINPIKLKEIVKKRLRNEKVNVLLNKEVTDSIFTSYDVIVNSTYANLNFILDKYENLKRDYQFEVCEKLVLKLPSKFKGLSVVVIDGPFFCIDPYGDTGFHVMGNVIHAIHKTNIGHTPIIPENFKSLLNNGLIKRPSVTNFKKFIESARYFIPEIVKAKHIGSMYTVRTVLPNVDKTDERPTLVYKIDDKIINVFSGKIGNSVQAALDVLGIVEKICIDQKA